MLPGIKYRIKYPRALTKICVSRMQYAVAPHYFYISQ